MSNELVVLRRGAKTCNRYLDVVGSGPLEGWIGLKGKPRPLHPKNPFLFLEHTQDKLIVCIQRSGWEIVEGLGTKPESGGSE